MVWTKQAISISVIAKKMTTVIDMAKKKNLRIMNMETIAIRQRVILIAMSMMMMMMMMMMMVMMMIMMMKGIPFLFWSNVQRLPKLLSKRVETEGKHQQQMLWSHLCIIISNFEGFVSQQ